MKKKKQTKQNLDSPAKTTLKERVSRMLSMPVETFFNLSQMQIVGNKEITLEGYQSIIAYDDNLLRIRAKGNDISFWGSELQINYMNNENIIITGKIEQIEFKIKGKGDDTAS